MKPRIRTLVVLLVAASIASAQSNPEFALSGKHYDHLVTFGSDVVIAKVLPDAGVMILSLQKAKGQWKLRFTDMNGKQIVKELFNRYKVLGRGYVQAISQRTDRWKKTLIHGPTKRVWSSRSDFEVLETGELIQQVQVGKEFLCRADGKTLIPLTGTYDGIEPDGKGTIRVEKGGMWGVVGLDGSPRVPFLYEKEMALGEGYRVVRLAISKAARMNPKHPLQRSNRHGVLSASGKRVMNFYYSSIKPPVGGVCTWTVGDKAGATDVRTGKKLLELKDDARTYRLESVDGKSILVVRSTKVDKLSLEYGIGPISSYRVFQVGSGYRTDWLHNITVHRAPGGFLYEMQKSAPARRKTQGAPKPEAPSELRNAQWRVIDQSVVRVVPSGQLFAVIPSKASNRKPYLVDGTGKVVVKSQSFTGQVLKKGEVYHDRIQIRVQGLWGYVNMSGTTVIPATYKSAQPFSAGGIAVVQTDTGFGVIDKNGKVVVQPKCKSVHCYPKLPYLQVTMEDHALFCNAAGEELFRAKKRFHMWPIAPNRLGVWEVANKKYVRWFLFALK